MAGLAAAIKLVAQGHDVHVYEAANHAGGRCRSFYDEQLKCVIDNGNHLVLSGNRAVASYVNLIGATDAFQAPEKAVFPFFDLETDKRWQVKPGNGLLPLWLLSASRGIPEVKLSEYFSAFKINSAKPGQTVKDCVGNAGKLFERFWEPLTLAALNTPSDQASALLLKAVLKETFFKGEKHCRPMVAKDGLSESLVKPALTYLKSNGAKVSFKKRLTGLVRLDGKIEALQFGTKTVPVSNDKVILALPPNITSELVKEIHGPDVFHAIVNVHYRLAKKSEGFSDVPFLGLLGGTAHWLFVRNNIASVTVSAADRLAEQPGDEIAELVWIDVARALNLNPSKVPPYRVIKEKRATFSQTPDSLRKRPFQKGPDENLYFAGDWTQTYIPATIESAVRSGFFAAEAIRLDLAKK